MKTKFYNADGSLTKYAFTCGYVQTETKGNSYKKLFQEHNTYHLIKMVGNERKIWLSYDNLTTARKDYKNTSLD